MDLEGEIWKPVEGWEDWYEVSNLGRMKSLPKPMKLADGRPWMRKEHIMRQQDHTSGYLQVGYGPKGKRKTWYVHRLVAEAFLGGKHPGKDVNHKNGNKKDNRVENLEWVTRKENMIHARDVLGSYSHIRVRQLTKDGKFVKEWRSLREAADAMGLASAASISIVINDKYKNNVTAGGFRWEKVE